MNIRYSLALMITFLACGQSLAAGGQSSDAGGQGLFDPVGCNTEPYSGRGGKLPSVKSAIYKNANRQLIGVEKFDADGQLIEASASMQGALTKYTWAGGRIIQKDEFHSRMKNEKPSATTKFTYDDSGDLNSVISNLYTMKRFSAQYIYRAGTKEACLKVVGQGRVAVSSQGLSVVEFDAQHRPIRSGTSFLNIKLYEQGDAAIFNYLAAAIDRIPRDEEFTYEQLKDVVKVTHWHIRGIQRIPLSIAWVSSKEGWDLEHMFFDNDGNLEQQRWVFKYKTDDHGNWIEREWLSRANPRAEFEVINNVSRTITY